MATVLKSGLWRTIGLHLSNEHQHAIFQPAGGMDMITRGFEKHVGQFVRPNSKVTAILQDDTGVKVDYLDTQTGEKLSAAADYCICTIPLSILSQIEMNVGAPLAAAIAAVPYRPSVKVGIEFKRRFWEQDEEIYGGITSTDLPISQISYPSDGYGSQGPGVLLAAYVGGPYSYELTSMPPAERVRKALEMGAVIHPQFASEYRNGVSVGWHRVPWTLGCFGIALDRARSGRSRGLVQRRGDRQPERQNHGKWRATGL